MNSTIKLSNTNRQIVVVMIHIFSQDGSYNQDYSLFFIVHEVVCLEALCSSDRSEINRKLAFSKVFLKVKSIRKVVVPCGCNTAQFELEINEEKKLKFQNRGLGSGLFLAQTKLFLAQAGLFLSHNSYKNRPTDSLF